MSSDKQRRARQKAERERWEREQHQAARRRRVRILLLSGVAVVVVAAVAAVGVVVAGRDTGDDDAGRDQQTATPQVQNTELLDAEASAEAQSAAANRAIAAGEVVADDFTVTPGTPVSSDDPPLPDDRPVACGAKPPAGALAARPRYPGGPASVLRDGVDYVARIETSCGPIVIDLLEDQAPLTVNSFVFLAREGFYDGLEVFRDFGGVTAAQAGSGNNTVDWDIGYRIPDEVDPEERVRYPVGTVTTAIDGPYTAGSEFLIAYGEAFDQSFGPARSQTAFGRVLSGMDVIDTMTAMDRTGLGGESFAERLLMESVTIQER